MKKDILTIEQWLVSNLITTQEFILENQTDEIQAKDLINIIKKYAEYYHKATVEGISDEEIEDKATKIIEKEGYEMHPLSFENECVTESGMISLIDWFKNKLLNDL